MSSDQDSLPFPESRPPQEDGWVLLARHSEVPEGEGLACRLGDTELALFVDGGEVHCLQDFCPHRGAALSDGRVADGQIICSWHGWKYRLDNGHCTTLPGSASAICYETRRCDDEIWVRLVRGNPDA